MVGGDLLQSAPMRRHLTPALLLAAVSTAVVLAQAPQFSNQVRGFIMVDAPVVALTNVRVIDGTGAPARENQTLILRGGNIAEIGDAGRIKAPEGATVVDLTGKSVIPGLVMVHEHLYYPTGPGVYGQLGRELRRASISPAASRRCGRAGIRTA